MKLGENKKINYMVDREAQKHDQEDKSLIEKNCT